MYNVAELDAVVEFGEIPKPNAGAPAPVVLANESSVVLSYRLAISDFAFVRFSASRMHLLGLPNDEALHGHPLWGRGLEFYSGYRAKDSSLIRRLERANSAHQFHQSTSFDALDHYIVTFHDSTFECVAKSVDILENIPSEEHLARMSH